MGKRNIFLVSNSTKFKLNNKKFSRKQSNIKFSQKSENFEKQTSLKANFELNISSIYFTVWQIFTRI